MASIPRIDFISSYCDRWCERCAFTDRCSAFACQVAIGMCGDAAEGLELAIGAPHPVQDDPAENAARREFLELLNVQPSVEEMAEIDRNEKARDVRLDRAALNRMARAHMMRSTSWLQKHRDRIAVGADPVVREALEIAAWDAYFIGAKVHRALDGRDRFQHDNEDCDSDPVQNDWNGSAKVALISLERTEVAWRVIGDATGDREASALADAIGTLRRVVLQQFPKAKSFVRPGFDEPWR
jgi:hypothetical protein